MEHHSLITLNIERLIGTYGRVTVEWVANGSISDVFPASGMVCNNITDVRRALTVVSGSRCRCSEGGGQYMLDYSTLLSVPASWSFPVILAVFTCGWHQTPQHHSCSARTRCCNAVQALEMCVCGILFPSSFLLAVRSSYCVKSST